MTAVANIARTITGLLSPRAGTIVMAEDDGVTYISDGSGVWRAMGSGDIYKSSSSSAITAPAVGGSVSLVAGTGLSYTINQGVVVSSTTGIFIGKVTEYDTGTGDMSVYCTQVVSPGANDEWIINLGSPQLLSSGKVLVPLVYGGFNTDIAYIEGTMPVPNFVCDDEGGLYFTEVDYA